MKWLRPTDQNSGSTKRFKLKNGVVLSFPLGCSKTFELGLRVSDDDAKYLLKRYEDDLEEVEETEFHKKANAKFKKSLTEEIKKKFGNIAKEVLPEEKPEKLSKFKKTKKK